MITNIYNIDISILNFIRDSFHNPFLDRIMILLTRAGDNGLIWIVISVALIISKKYRRVGVMSLSSLVFSYLLGDLLIKNLVQRDRPFVYLDSIQLLISLPSSFSFPSGHTSSSFAAAIVLAKNFKKYGVLFIVLAALIAFSRMYLYVHYPTDILGGMVLGAICANIALVLFKKLTVERK